MNALKIASKAALKWFGIFILGTIVVVGMALFRGDGAAAGQKIVGFVGASFLLTILIFIKTLFANLFQKKKSPKTDAPNKSLRLPPSTPD